MKFYQPILITGLIGAAMVVTARPVKADALLPTEVADIARKTVVQIRPTIAAPGSGVIIGRKQEGKTYIYTVLTASHVVQHPDDLYSIVTPLPLQGREGQNKRQKISISPNDIQKVRNLDLAIIRFRSDRLYDTATLGNSDHTTEGAGVYIAGFPNPGEAITRRVFQFTSSLVSSRLDLAGDVEGEESTAVVEGGYALSYTNVTRAGMSGGPIFDVSGRVVGIHGMGDGERITGGSSSRFGRESASAARSYVLKTGFNLGIPIKSFLGVFPDARNSFSISYDPSMPGILPGGGLIAMRGGSQNRNNINISEEEDPTDDIVVTNSQPVTESSQVQPQTPQTPVTPIRNPEPEQPIAPVTPEPTPSQPVDNNSGPFF